MCKHLVQRRCNQHKLLIDTEVHIQHWCLHNIYKCNTYSTQCNDLNYVLYCALSKLNDCANICTMYNVMLIYSIERTFSGNIHSFNCANIDTVQIFIHSIVQTFMKCNYSFILSCKTFIQCKCSFTCANIHTVQIFVQLDKHSLNSFNYVNIYY